MSNPVSQPAEISLELTNQLAEEQDKRWELIADHYARHFPMLQPIAYDLIRLFDVKEVTIDEEDFEGIDHEDITYGDAEDLLRQDLLDEIVDLEAAHQQLAIMIADGVGDEHCQQRATELQRHIEIARTELEKLDFFRIPVYEEPIDYSQIWWDWDDIPPEDIEKFGATPPLKEHRMGYTLDSYGFIPASEVELTSPFDHDNFAEPLEETQRRYYNS